MHLSIRKEDLLKLINQLPDGELIQVEAVLGEEVFDFDCSIRTFVNEDDGSWRLRVECADTSETDVELFEEMLNDLGVQQLEQVVRRSRQYDDWTWEMIRERFDRLQGEAGCELAGYEREPFLRVMEKMIG